MSVRLFCGTSRLTSLCGVFEGTYIRLRECKFVSRRRRTQTRYGSRFRCLLQHIKNCKTPIPYASTRYGRFIIFHYALRARQTSVSTWVIRAKGIFYAKNGGCKAKRYILCIVFWGDKSFFYKAFRTTTQVEHQIFGHEFCNQKFLALNLFERKFVNLKGIAPQIVFLGRKAVL